MEEVHNCGGGNKYGVEMSPKFCTNPTCYKDKQDCPRLHRHSVQNCNEHIFCQGDVLQGNKDTYDNKMMLGIQGEFHDPDLRINDVNSPTSVASPVQTFKKSESSRSRKQSAKIGSRSISNSNVISPRDRSQTQNYKLKK